MENSVGNIRVVNTECIYLNTITIFIGLKNGRSHFSHLHPAHYKNLLLPSCLEDYPAIESFVSGGEFGPISQLANLGHRQAFWTTLQPCSRSTAGTVLFEHLGVNSSSCHNVFHPPSQGLWCHRLVWLALCNEKFIGISMSQLSCSIWISLQGQDWTYRRGIGEVKNFYPTPDVILSRVLKKQQELVLTQI